MACEGETRRFLFLDCTNIGLKVDKKKVRRVRWDLCLSVMIWSTGLCISFRTRILRVCCSLICGVDLALVVVRVLGLL
jgi:hypothetical protein